MTQFDDTDLEILRLLLTDGRRAYSDIADRVDLSPPAVSDRVDRLQEEGVIRRVTLDLDRSKLTGGTEVLVEVRVAPTAVEEVQASLRDRDEVEHVFVTADARVFLKAFVDQGDVRTFLADAVDLGEVREFEVHLLTGSSWTPGLGSTAFDIECAECGNTVTEEGVTARIGGERHHFCCESCESQFANSYEQLAEGAE